jgi:hypothetical protein
MRGLEQVAGRPGRWFARVSRISPYWRCNAARAGGGIISPTARRKSSCRKLNACSAAVMIAASIASSTAGSSAHAGYP